MKPSPVRSPGAARRWAGWLTAALLFPWGGPASAGTCPAPQDLPLPSTQPLDQYEGIFGAFLDKLCYRNPAWAQDKGMRNTGPHLVYQADSANGSQWSSVDSGTHTAVWIHYSPEVYQWVLRRERRAAEQQLAAVGSLSDGGKTDAEAAAPLPPIPDGAMIIKEMWRPPAQQYTGAAPAIFQADGKVNPAFNGWAVMVKDSGGSRDGWFWGYYYPHQKPDWPAGLGLANMGFGQYCVNCHASTEDEFTYSSLRNIAGGPGSPISFTTQALPLDVAVEPETLEAGSSHEDRERLAATDNDCSRLSGDIIDCAAFTDNRLTQPMAGYPEAFRKAFPVPALPPTQATVAGMPPAGYDHTVAGSKGPKEFITADQCLGCHDAGATGVQRSNMTLWLEDIRQYANLSPYGEWRQSPMGLAGRDPIFFAQLESERKFHPAIQGYTQDLCLHCHGVMGQRQFHIDHPDKTCTTADQKGCFQRAFADAVPFPTDNPKAPLAPYGALARDGIACTVCHHIKLPPIGEFADTFTGNFDIGPATEVYGPFEDVKTAPMAHSFDIKPIGSEDIRRSEICGSCHTIKLPVYDGSEPVKTAQGKQKYAYEQATYLEWLFSDFRKGQYQTIGSGPTPRSCQDCHMPNGFGRGKQLVQGLASRIATIEESSHFPEADFRLPPEEIDLAIRSGYARHTLVGANLFILEMFEQFPSLLGVSTTDPMLGASAQASLITAEESIVYQADAGQVAELALAPSLGPETLTVDLTVSNRNGHKFPSGVGFRRAFVGFEVLDASGQVLWASGRSNGEGVIVDQNGQPVAGEFWHRQDCSGPAYAPPAYPYQPHYQVIDRQDQVQVYQELAIARDGFLTTSFLGIDRHLKDNRLLPQGFRSVLKGKSLRLDAQTLALARIIGIDVGDPDEREFLEDIAPFGIGEARGAPDPDYLDGAGRDRVRYAVPIKDLGDTPARVRATLYSQSIPPFYLQDRFCTRPDGEDTQRLYFLAGHLDLSDSRASGWKFSIQTAEAALPTY